jgi:hypothetical protein
MRYFCWCCHKSVTSELPEDSVIRALLVCPECIEANRVIFPDTEAAAAAHLDAHDADGRQPR